ncbi:MAG: glycosyltransferase, partial [Thermodesulfobacteriota bacterium]
LEKIEEGYTVVSGWRRDRKDRTVTRKLPSFFANRLISTISRVPLHDYGCTLKAYRREFIEDLGIYGEMHRFLPVYAKWKGARIAEVPVNHRARAHGQSKYGLERTFKVLFDLLLIKFYDSFSAKPMYAFGFTGLLSIFASICFFLAMIYFKYWGGKTFIQTPLPLLTVQFFLIGVMCFLLGITTDMVMRTYYESQRRRPYLISRVKNLQP